jgi:hypothetical protein
MLPMLALCLAAVAVATDPCAVKLDCQTCSAATGCGWCVEDSSCVTATGADCTCTGDCHSCLKTGASAVCPTDTYDCSTHMSCTSCAADKACGWNLENLQCYPGDSYGACWSSGSSKCTGSADASLSWQYGATAVCSTVLECNNHQECASCKADPACGWNVQDGTCAAGDNKGACHSSEDDSCSGSATKGHYWQYGPKAVCPFSNTCAARRNCAECIQDPACGWNAYDNTCVPGDDKGACHSSEDDSCSGSAAKGFYWRYGPKAVCPAKNSTCKQYTDCRACATDPACGWDIYDQQCSWGDKTGSCYSSEEDKCSGRSKTSWIFNSSSLTPCPVTECTHYR